MTATPELPLRARDCRPRHPTVQQEFVYSSKQFAAEMFCLPSSRRDARLAA